MRKVLAVFEIIVAISVTFRILQILTDYADYTDMIERVLLGIVIGSAVISLNLEWISKSWDKLKE